MHYIGTKSRMIVPDAQQKLKTEFSRPARYTWLGNRGISKILVISANGTDSMLKALTTQPLYYFQNSDFRASDAHPIDNMQHA